METVREFLNRCIVGGPVNVTIQDAEGGISFEAILTGHHFFEPNQSTDLRFLEIPRGRDYATGRAWISHRDLAVGLRNPLRYPI